ncbi:MAG: scpA [Patescibacteria group bacterium]|nr:scpA [Patescibacteria group bacterium]
MSDYVVKTTEFEGPIHLLLKLIEDRKMHVSEVSLASVTEDFLKFMETHQLSYGQISSFVVVAGALLLVKARSLLPAMELSEEEEESITDLTERIRQYQIVKNFAEKLVPIWQKQISFERTYQDKTPVFAPDVQITTSILDSLIQNLFQAFPIIEKIPEKAIKTVVKLEEVIENLAKRIQSGITFHSRDMMDKYRNAVDPVERRQAKVFAVVSFLAILELVKKGIAGVMQNENFDDIELVNPPTV